jgi:hypothetical protein
MDNALGAFLGSACGDAAGGVLEFLNRAVSEADVDAAMRMPGGGTCAHLGCTLSGLVCELLQTAFDASFLFGHPLQVAYGDWVLAK